VIKSAAEQIFVYKETFSPGALYLLLLLQYGFVIISSELHVSLISGAKLTYLLNFSAYIYNTTAYIKILQQPIQWVPEALSLGVKRPGREADHSPPSSAEVKNAWSYISTPPLRLHGVVLS
jgi:hypothetical protein